MGNGRGPTYYEKYGGISKYELASLIKDEVEHFLQDKEFKVNVMIHREVINVGIELKA